MKRKLYGFIVAGVALLSACVPNTANIYTDEATGCQYLYSSHGGYEPRLNSDGKPICK